jgi:hypothetical protein
MSKGERLCRFLFEQMVQKPFVSCRPAFLRASSMRCLELDGYCKEYRLAFEYHGKQHYQFVPFFHKKENEFYTQLERDFLKKDLCLKNDIWLIEVPFRIKDDFVKSFIFNELRKAEKARGEIYIKSL